MNTVGSGCPPVQALTARWCGGCCALVWSGLSRSSGNQESSDHPQRSGAPTDAAALDARRAIAAQTATQDNGRKGGVAGGTLASEYAVNAATGRTR
jgi:hypothetical protein